MNGLRTIADFAAILGVRGLHDLAVVNLVGEHVGNYVVTRELGAGGMGTVYLAEHPILKRKVAVKVLHDEHATDKETVERFFQEARAAAEIGEEHIIDVIDFGELTVRGWKVVYLMMELLEGISLGKRIQRGAIPPEEVAHIVGQICLALSASHAKGIIHRDLKPENVYLCPRSSDAEFVKVLDFGIAKLTGSIKGSGRTTRIGTVLGTPAYMSPEQCVGIGDIDRRADVYALGVMMFEMLTGELPFGGDVAELIDAHLRRAPDPPSRRNPGVPPAWDAIVLHCMEKARDDRFASMDDIAAAIRDPAAHLASYQQQVAVRIAAIGSHRTAVLPSELRPDHVATADSGGEVAFVARPPQPALPFLQTALAPTITPLPSAPLPIGTPAPFIAPPGYFTPVGQVLTAPVPAARLAAVSRRHVIAAIAGAVALVVAVITIVTVRDETPAPAPVIAVTTGDAAVPVVATAVVVPTDAPPVVVPSPPVASDAAPVPPLRLTITSTPAGAKVTIRRGATISSGTTPHVLEVPAADPTPISLTVTARGYETVTQTLTPHADADVLIVLPRAAPTPRPRVRPRDSDLIHP